MKNLFKKEKPSIAHCPLVGSYWSEPLTILGITGDVSEWKLLIFSIAFVVIIIGILVGTTL